MAGRRIACSTDRGMALARPGRCPLLRTAGASQGQGVSGQGLDVSLRGASARQSA